MNLEKSRKEIDDIDAEIITLLNKRAKIARSIGEFKSRSGLPVFDDGREIEVIRRAVSDSCGLIDDASIERIYGEILAESRRIQVDVAEQVKNTEVTI